MLETYKATLRGDKIEWKGESPQNLSAEKTVNVFVTILEEPKTAKGKKLRPFGLCKDQFVVPDDFDASLPEEILASFEK